MKQQFHKKGKGKEKKTAGLNYETWGIFTNPICIYFRRTYYGPPKFRISINNIVR